MLSEIKVFLKYSSRTYQANQIWLPCILTALFMLVIGLFSKYLRPLEVSSAFTGVVLPLMGGTMAAYSTLDDPCLELHFSTPRSALTMLMNRFILILSVLSICSVVFQIFVHQIGLDLSSFGSIWQRQLNWLIPCLGYTSIGFFAAYTSTQSNSGAIAVGLVWILQVVAREWFLMTPIANLFFMFTGALYPLASTISASQSAIWILSVAFLGASWRFLLRQERYI